MLQIKGNLCFYLLLVNIIIGFMLHLNDSFGIDITLSWDEIYSKDLVEYRIFCREAGQSYNYINPAWKGTEEICTIYNLKDKTTFCFVARAFDNCGNESSNSNEVCYQPIKNSPGWQLISLPVIPESTLVSDLFPEAVVVYGYKIEVGYFRVKEKDNLKVGKGYWILFKKPQSYCLSGQPIKSYTHNIYKDGWYMIGGCTSPAQASANKCNIDVIYGYVHEVGYQRLLESDDLKPGKGYWILLSDVVDQAELIVSFY